ncbi:polymorphic toxin-type HINT domain-containing protein [Actinomadura sp. ATCC 39365]
MATWSSAEELKQGMFLRMSAGTYAQVQGIRKWTAHQRVHNLTVADFHTYYVLAGAASVLVHNTSPSWIPGPRELTAVWLSPNKTLEDSFQYHYDKPRQAAQQDAGTISSRRGAGNQVDESHRWARRDHQGRQGDQLLV